jgi:hypothetical protein
MTISLLYNEKHWEIELFRFRFYFFGKFAKSKKIIINTFVPTTTNPYSVRKLKVEKANNNIPNAVNNFHGLFKTKQGAAGGGNVCKRKRKSLFSHIFSVKFN